MPGLVVGRTDGGRGSLAPGTRWQGDRSDRRRPRTRAFPWLYGTLVDSPAFERFRPYFTDDTTWAEDDPAIEALCGEIQDRGLFALRDLRTGQLRLGVPLYQDGDTVWFRISLRHANPDDLTSVCPTVPRHAIRRNPLGCAAGESGSHLRTMNIVYLGRTTRDGEVRATSWRLT